MELSDRRRRRAHRLPLTHHEFVVQHGRLRPHHCRAWRVATVWVIALASIAYTILFWKGVVPQHYESMERYDGHYFADTTLGRFCTFKVTLLGVVILLLVISTLLERQHLLQQHGPLMQNVEELRRLVDLAAEKKGSDVNSATAQDEDLSVTVTTSPRRIDFDIVHASWGSMRFSTVRNAFEYLSADPAMFEHTDADLCRRVRVLVDQIG